MRAQVALPARPVHAGAEAQVATAADERINDIPIEREIERQLAARLANALYSRFYKTSQVFHVTFYLSLKVNAQPIAL